MTVVSVLIVTTLGPTASDISTNMLLSICTSNGGGTVSVEVSANPVAENTAINNTEDTMTGVIQLLDNDFILIPPEQAM